jgi:hypothetical protein
VKSSVTIENKEKIFKVAQQKENGSLHISYLPTLSTDLLVLSILDDI